MVGAGDSSERLQALAEAVRRSNRAHTDVLTCRNNEIIECNAAGMSLGEIAKATGLSRGYIQDLVTNHEVRELTSSTPGTTDPGRQNL